MNIVVQSPGLQTTVQDVGRTGHRHLGVAACGVLDATAAALANRLVGNDVDTAVLEFALQGPTLSFEAPIRIALLGADFQMRFGRTDIPAGRPVTLPAGTLHVGPARSGVRAWLAIAGGIDVATVLGSRSTDLRGGFGGFEGRALRAGDVLPLGDIVVPDPGRPDIAAWWIEPCDDAPPDAPLRIVPARAGRAPSSLCDQSWKVDSRSDRQGLRLDGNALRSLAHDGVSSPVAPGTIQLPPDGRPIVLLNDAQTVGGYPVLGHVIGSDLPRLAQAAPHTQLRFVACDQVRAWALKREARAKHARTVLAVEQRLAGGRRTL